MVVIIVVAGLGNVGGESDCGDEDENGEREAGWSHGVLICGCC